MGRREDWEEFGQNLKCIGTICGLVSLIIVLFMVLWYYTVRATLPTCSVQEFYVTALNRAVNTTTNPSEAIFFDIKIDNKNKVNGIMYDPINLTFYYGSDNSYPVGNYIIPGFYQGIKKSTYRRDVVETRGVPWKVATWLVSNGSTMSFRVGMETTVRFKFMGILNKRHEMDVVAIVEVNDSGENVSNGGNNFKSDAMSPCRGWIGLSAVVIAFVFMF